MGESPAVHQQSRVALFARSGRDRNSISHFFARTIRAPRRRHNFLTSAVVRRVPMALCRRRSLLVESIVDHFLGLPWQHRFCRRFLFGALRLAFVEGQIARGGGSARSEFMDQTSNGVGDSRASPFHS